MEGIGHYTQLLRLLEAKDKELKKKDKALEETKTELEERNETMRSQLLICNYWTGQFREVLARKQEEIRQLEADLGRNDLRFGVFERAI